MPPVEIVPASPSWTQEFDAIGQALRECLGDLALRIDHIGSTSVPGLAAKDMIDVQVTVAELDSDHLIPAFASAGYVHRPDNPGDHRPPGAHGPDQDWAKLFFSEASGRPVNIHVRVIDRPNQRYALLFRDYLRAHPPTAAAYAEAKRRLAELAGDDIGRYAEAKDPIVDLIYLPAEEWAARTGWTPGPSDC